MNDTDRQAIGTLFARLADVERKTPARDPEAEREIAAGIARQPGAPYYLAQTVVVQEHALNEAQARIAALEAELGEARGGFLSGLWGGGPARPAPRRPQAMPQGAPGGFLAGAAQTAMGVAGGVLIANAVGGLFGGAAAAVPEGDGGEGYREDWTDEDAGDAGDGDLGGGDW